MKKRLLCFTLIALMLLSALVGCKKENGEATSDDTSGTVSSVTDQGASNQPQTNILDTLPQKSYGGKEFTISTDDALAYQMDAEKITGDLANDTIYNWIKTIQERYDVKITLKKDGLWGDFYKNIGVEINGGECQNLYSGIAFKSYEAVLNGIFRDWNSMGDMIDLTAPRWDKHVNDASTYNGKLYTLTGSLGVSKMQYTIATFYNVEILENNQISSEYLYDLVDKGKWTLEAMETIAKDIYEDLDKSETKSAGDLFGYVSATGNSRDIWFPAFGIEITSRDKDNTITPTLYTESNINIVERLCNFYHNHQGIAILDNVYESQESTLFSQGRTAMCSTYFYSAFTTFREMGSKAYGILPTPKLNETQEKYYSKLNDQYGVWGVATSLPESEVDFTAHITDALCAQSYTEVYHQYYDIILKNRYSKDATTAKMVDMVMENVSFDTAIMFGEYLESYPYIVRDLITENSSDIASLYKGKETAIKEKLQTIYDCYKD